MGLAAYKAQYDGRHGYPAHLVPGLAERLALPWPVGTPAGGPECGVARPHRHLARPRWRWR
ncbi:MAG: hypothetical protein U1E17_04450 [Geminicoccaceae bacterium]